MGHLFISFTGALVFVSRYEVESRPARNEMRVLLAESRPIPSRSHDSHDMHETHFPRLICPADSVVVDSERPAYKLFKNRGMAWAMFDLDDQDVFVPGEREALAVTSPAVSDCPTPDTVCSYSWVVPLSEVDPGSEFVKPECFETLHPDSSVVARVALTQGLIHTHEVAGDVVNGVIRWVFRPVDEETKIERGEQAQGRAIADSVMYETDFEGDTIELRTRLFRSPTQSTIGEIYPDGVGSERRIRLRPIDGTIHAFVKNMTPPDLLGERREEPVRGPDVHFAHVYGLSQQARRRNVPHPVGRCDSSPKSCPTNFPPRHNTFAFYHKGNPNCPPPKAAAFSDPGAWDFELARRA